MTTTVKIWTIIAIYWVVAIITTYAIRYYNDRKRRLAKAVMEGLIGKPSVWKRISTHTIIVFLLPALIPIFIPCYLIVERKTIFKRKDKESQEDEEKKIETKIDEDLPSDQYTQAAIAMMNAMTTGDFSEFENMLSDDAITICYGYDTFRGKAASVDYLKGWRERHIVTSTRRITDFEVQRNNYYSHACLRMERMIALFRISNERISTIILTPLELTNDYNDDNMTNYPLDLERMRQYLEPLTESVDEEGNPIDLGNRIPCLQCGVESSGLTWYKSTRPNFFYHNWEAGQLSVCPNCGKVVEYKHIKTIELTADKNKWTGPKRPNNGNEYSTMASKFYSEEKIKMLNEEETATEEETAAFVSYLLEQFTDVELEPGCTLELRLPEETGHGDNSHLCVCDPSGESTEDIIHNLIVKPTVKAAWQLYLLNNITDVLPHFWHGCYNKCTYIFQESVIDGILPLKFHDLSELSAQNLFVPLVEVKEKNEQGCTMLVRCCYWNAWRGLVKEEVNIRIENGRCVSYERNTTDLFKYHCGMWF